MPNKTDDPDDPLSPPHSFIFSIRQCTDAYRLNKFAIALKDPETRARFVADEHGLMTAFGLSAGEKEFVSRRDWAGLVASGGHVLAIVKIAYALGVLHHEVGAHMCGVPYRDLRDHLAAIRVDEMPRIGAGKG